MLKFIVGSLNVLIRLLQRIEAKRASQAMQLYDASKRLEAKATSTQEEGVTAGKLAGNIEGLLK